ncbi:uncharacterized protein LOC135137733 isoform X1 [Zophobas morio]|uniref:uncharacterized protein LOC135137733 isoform X1 n=1 Tax=Zophobas morio TaxID=2755281 RepID=UPI003083C7BB
MDFKEWMKSPYSYFLVVYSCIVTIVMMILFIYVIKLKIDSTDRTAESVKKKKKKNVLKADTKFSNQGCADMDKLEDLEELNDIVVDNNYNDDMSSRHLYRTKSCPLRSFERRRISEYDAVACSSKYKFDTNPPLVHHSEEVTGSMIDRANPCDEILRDVSTALFIAHSHTSSSDVYQSVARQLLNLIKVKKPSLYETIQCDASRHTYDKIDYAKMSNINLKSESDSSTESIYGTYIPPASHKSVEVEGSNEFSGNQRSSPLDVEREECFQDPSEDENYQSLLT